MAAQPALGQGYGLSSPRPIARFLGGVMPQGAPGPSGSWMAENAFPNLTFIDPIRLVTEPNLNRNRSYILCKNGQVWWVNHTPSVSVKNLFLDVSTRTQTAGDCGMLGFAFHPEFGVPGSPNRGYVYVHYQYSPAPVANAERASYFRVSQFTVSDGQSAVNPNSELVLINQSDRRTWHNGGAMEFGADGFLYVTNGDEGDANDSFNNGQKINERLFGGVLRIDVDKNPARSHPIRRQPRPLPICLLDGRRATHRNTTFPTTTHGWILPPACWRNSTRSACAARTRWLSTRQPGSSGWEMSARARAKRCRSSCAGETPSGLIYGGQHQRPEGEAGEPDRHGPAPPVWDYGRSTGSCVIGGAAIVRGPCGRPAVGNSSSATTFPSRLWRIGPRRVPPAAAGGKYLDSGAGPGSAWREPDFDDAGWGRPDRPNLGSGRTATRQRL